jgi:hypothetical protein
MVIIPSDISVRSECTFVAPRWRTLAPREKYFREIFDGTEVFRKFFIVSFIVPPVSLLQTTSTLNLISYTDITRLVE